MIAIATSASRISPEEYLEEEKLADVRHEYVDGHVYAMAGASADHSSLDICRRPLPKGELRIARQFTAGFESEIAQVPKGRLNPFMSYVSSYSDCVFCTKRRRLTAQIQDRLWPFLGGIAPGRASLPFRKLLWQLIECLGLTESCEGKK